MTSAKPEREEVVEFKVRMPKSIHTHLQLVAHKNRRSMNQLAVDALEMLLSSYRLDGTMETNQIRVDYSPYANLTDDQRRSMGLDAEADFNARQAKYIEIDTEAKTVRMSSCPGHEYAEGEATKVQYCNVGDNCPEA